MTAPVLAFFTGDFTGPPDSCWGALKVERKSVRASDNAGDAPGASLPDPQDGRVVEVEVPRDPSVPQPPGLLFFWVFPDRSSPSPCPSRPCSALLPCILVALREHSGREARPTRTGRFSCRSS